MNHRSARCARPFLPWLARGAVLWALVAPTASLAAGCPPNCASVASVVHAAGVPPGVAAQVAALRFEGNALQDTDGAVKALADALKALPASAVVTLKVGADAGLSGVAARRQATARAAALRSALRQAGAGAKRVSVTAA